MKKIISGLCLLGLNLFLISSVFAQNPLILNQFTADPSARVFGDKIYIYPSHDILATPGHGRMGWFCMEDYHVFSSANLTDWTDHGVIVSQTNVPWADPAAYSMWAPDCIFRNGKYYFYFPTKAKQDKSDNGFSIGVAIADKPTGLFVPQPEPIKKVVGIDPNVFIDKDGQAYLYWAQGNIYAAKLNSNMLEMASEPQILGELPQTGLKEGPYLFERNGIYYLTYPHVANKTERLEYATSSNPLGPFKFAGVIMDESASGCWTNHQSIIKFKNQWFLFYHNDDLSPNFDKARSIRADSLFFNADGTIKKVIPTLRGIGITKADSKIQLDRYTAISKEGASIAFIDTANKQKGWKTILTSKNAWIQYNSIDFGNKNVKSINLNATSTTGGTVEIHIDKINGPLLSKVNFAKSSEWTVVHTALNNVPSGIHNLFVVNAENKNVEIDFLSFNN